MCWLNVGNKTLCLVKSRGCYVSSHTYHGDRKNSILILERPDADLEEDDVVEYVGEGEPDAVVDICLGLGVKNRHHSYQHRTE